MHQTLLFDSYIYKATEVGNIVHNAGQFHSFSQILYGLYILVKFKNLDLLPWVASRLVQFLHDVCQGGKPHCRGDILLDINPAAQFFAFYQFVYGAVQVFGYLLHYGIAFGMHGRVVQRILCLWDTQEPCALLKRFRSHPGYFQ